MYFNDKKNYLLAGVKVKLDNNWKIYWKNPGEAGLPPKIIFDKISNVSNVNLLFPEPKSFKFFNIDTFGYDKEIIFPFKKMGLKKGDKLITLLPNTFEACTIHWACQLTGIVIVPINWRVKSEEIIFFLNNSNSKCIICDDYSEKEIQSSNLSNSIIKISTSLLNMDFEKYYYSS